MANKKKITIISSAVIGTTIIPTIIGACKPNNQSYNEFITIDPKLSTSTSFRFLHNNTTEDTFIYGYLVNPEKFLSFEDKQPIKNPKKNDYNPNIEIILNDAKLLYNLANKMWRYRSYDGLPFNNTFFDANLNYKIHKHPIKEVHTNIDLFDIIDLHQQNVDYPIINPNINTNKHHKKVINFSEFKQRINNMKQLDIHTFINWHLVRFFEGISFENQPIVYEQKIEDVIKDNRFLKIKRLINLYKSFITLEVENNKNKNLIKEKKYEFIIKNKEVLNNLISTIIFPIRYTNWDYSLKQLNINFEFIKEVYKEFKLKLKDVDEVKKISDFVSHNYDFRNHEYFDPNLIGFKISYNTAPKFFLNMLVAKQEPHIAYGYLANQQNILNPIHNEYNFDFYQNAVKYTKARSINDFLKTKKQLASYLNININSKEDNQIINNDWLINQLNTNWLSKLTHLINQVHNESVYEDKIIDLDQYTTLVVDFWKIYYDLIQTDLVEFDDRISAWSVK